MTAQEEVKQHHEQRDSRGIVQQAFSLYQSV
jgi:hypothetical protein